MDIKEIKNKLLEDHNHIKTILNQIGCDRITNNNKEYRCAKDSKDSNSTRVCVKLNETLSSKIYDITPIKGDIFTLIMELSNKNFKQSIKLCCDVLGINYNLVGINDNKNKIKRKAFGGFYNRRVEFEIENYTFHDESILGKYINKGNKRFKDDNIDYEIQTIFSIMFDDESNRIITPWRDSIGRIIGIMGRYNESADYCNENGISKWLPLKGLNFPKSNFLYGFYENYYYILKHGVVYVGESEKFVLQMASFGFRNCVAIGSHDISLIQRRLLLSLGVDIITCMDNDISESFNRSQCERLKSKSSLLRRNIGFLKTNEILIGKESPSDRGRDIFLKCIEEENIIYV